MTREPSPLRPRAASGSASTPVEKPEASHRPHPGCPVCAGTGRVHVQLKNPFRVESRECECECWRVVEQAADERELRVHR